MHIPHTHTQLCVTLAIGIKMGCKCIISLFCAYIPVVFFFMVFVPLVIQIAWAHLPGRHPLWRLNCLVQYSDIQNLRQLFVFDAFLALAHYYLVGNTKINRLWVPVGFQKGSTVIISRTATIVAFCIFITRGEALAIYSCSNQLILLQFDY